MAGTEKRGRRRGRGRSKRPREQDMDDTSVPHEAPRPPQAAAQYFAPFDYSAPSTPALSTFGAAGQLSEGTPRSQSITGPSYLGGASSPVTHSHAPVLGKVAIPPMQYSRVPQQSRRDSKRGRTPHACDVCRKAKAGCSGGNPCTRCQSAGVPCIYGDGKRDKDRKRVSKLRKETDSLSQHNSDVTDALRQIRLDESLTPDDMRSALDKVLAMNPAAQNFSSDEEKASVDFESFGLGLRSPSPHMKLGSEMSDDAAEVGSTGSLDVVKIDTDKTETRATGYMGKSSSVTWAKRTANEVQKTGASVASLGLDSGFTSTTYHTEDNDIDHIVPKSVDPFDWPDPKIADDYVRSYFEHIHHAFPILDKADFMLEYNQFKRGSRKLTPSQTIYLGTLNAVFAISSQYAQLTEIQESERHFEHYMYCARAKGLLVDDGFLYQDVSIKSLRALGLMSLYYMAAGRLNRAWPICGLAMRHALTLGLHVRSEAKDLSDVGKEQRVRLWWSLYAIECSLDELTGRPTCISDQDISTPLPLNDNMDEMRPDQSLYDNIRDRGKPYGSGGRKDPPERPGANFAMPTGNVQSLVYSFPFLKLPITSSTYFIYQTQLTIISHEIISQLYCAATIKIKWHDVQSTIDRIDKHLIDWHDSLPNEFDIGFDDWHEPDWNNQYTKLRIGLALHYHSSRMILFRPCLCRFDKGSRLGDQSAESQAFNQSSVKKCIDSARCTVSILKGASRSMRRLYSISPWWQIIHFLCEALSILVLEMAFKAQHMPKKEKEILDDAKKGVHWLAKMAGRSISARKAWEIYDILVKATAPIIGWSVFDMPVEAPCPPEYKEWPLTQLTEQLSPAQVFQPPLDQSSYSQQTSNWRPGQLPWTGLDLPEEHMLINPLDRDTVIDQFNNHWGMRTRWFNNQPWQPTFDFPNVPETTNMACTSKEETLPEMQVEAITGNLNQREEAEVFIPSATTSYGTPTPFFYGPFTQPSRNCDFGGGPEDR